MMDIDIHVLTIPSRKAWLEGLLASLEGQPCNVHVVERPEVESPIRRDLGFQQGSAPFVGYVDDDDLVEPGAVQSLIDALSANPHAVGAFTDEILVDADGKFLRNGHAVGKDWSLYRHLGSPKFVHHLWAGRRESVERYMAEVTHTDVVDAWALTNLMSIDGPWIHVQRVGYRWRQHDGGYHRKATQHVEAIDIMAKHIVRRWVEAGVMEPKDVPLRLRSAL